MNRFSPETRTTALQVLAGTCVLAAVAAGIPWWAGPEARHTFSRAPLLLAPMIGVIEPCIESDGNGKAGGSSGLAAACTGPQGSAAALVEATLSELQQPGGARGGGLELGYTLPVPLLGLFVQRGGQWVIDDEKVGRLVRTLRDSDRQAVLYLFSTHFDAGSALEQALAADPRNLAQTRDGPMPDGKYYDSAIHYWNLADTGTDLTARRVQAARAVLDQVCRLEPRHRQKIRGVTLLGELHHFFPDFEHGMGFDRSYRVTDYSPRSVADFRAFLQSRFGTIAALNAHLAENYAAFAEVVPPARDIRTEPLTRYADHIDSFAGGVLPVAGWAYVPGAVPGRPAWVQVYRNGEFVDRRPVDFSRQDVLQAMPQFGTANTGWRVDVDFKNLATGLHRIDVYLEQPTGGLAHLGTRQIAVMDRQQRAPQPLPQRPQPPSAALAPPLQASIDLPADQSSYYYNPLVPLWHAFRQQQVRAYLQFFNRAVEDSCLHDRARFTHQIVPFANPGWDADKFAIGASLQDLGPLRLGVSLYGDATYGPSLADWLVRNRHHGPYGVTEFHPLKAMDAHALKATLDRHAAQGADFVSFFVEPRWQGALVPRGHNLFSFGPENRAFGSDVLYRSVQQVLADR